MSHSDEILDVVDARDCVLGQATRRDIHVRGLCHRAVHLFLFNPGGDLFVQKRSATKDTFPLCYDSSASGHVDQSESYDACVVREVQEELGLKIQFQLLRKHFQLSACAETGWEFVWVYSIQGGYVPLVNPAEIDAGAFWPPFDVTRLLSDHPDRCAPSFMRIFCEFQQRKLLP